MPRPFLVFFAVSVLCSSACGGADSVSSSDAASPADELTDDGHGGGHLGDANTEHSGNGNADIPRAQGDALEDTTQPGPGVDEDAPVADDTAVTQADAVADATEPGSDVDQDAALTPADVAEETIEPTSDVSGDSAQPEADAAADATDPTPDVDDDVAGPQPDTEQDGGGSSTDGQGDVTDAECVPVCASNHPCGDDGCGGSCGTCAQGESCSENGQCECDPSCEGKECGDDGCGGSCGECSNGATCDDDAQCHCEPDCAGDCQGSASLNSCGVCAPEPVEVCNHQDDDCDGEVDEGLTLCFPSIEEMDYANYSRDAAESFTPRPPSIPSPAKDCAALEGLSWPGSPEACTVPEGACVVLASGAEVLCPGGVDVHGLLWMKSDSPAETTLLVADYVTVHASGSLFVTDSEGGPAHRAELFLRHEYCGKPEEDGTSTLSPDEVLACRAKGKLMAMNGTIKIAGLEKTPWALLVEDTDDTHGAYPNSIQVDVCEGWEAGDLIVVAATGGDAPNWHLAIAQPGCDESDCTPAFNFKSERRTVTDIALTEQGCLVQLDSPLRVNHRGSPVADGDPMPRLQAEVVNYTRSVIVTGGYLEEPGLPASRVATAYDYATQGQPTASFGPNLESTPCRVCDAPAPACDDPAACIDYDVGSQEDAGDSTRSFCGPGCSTLGAQGISTMLMGSGVMQISHSLVQHCGRRELAEYCLHFHHVGDVRHHVEAGTTSHASYLYGNAVLDGVNKGITIHGTHHAQVQRNVVLDHRGPGIYIEDGNELGNLVEENVVICSELSAAGQVGGIHRNSLCRLKNVSNRYQTKDSDYDEVSGLYFLAPTNHTIGNRVVGYDNGMYVNVNTSGSVGLGAAEGKVCPTAAPFGFTVGNVFHNNAGFGWYANKAYPQDMINLGGIVTDPTGASGEQGHVSDWSLCLPFSEAGDDQSFNVRIEKHLEYFNDFSAGVYDMGDVTLSDYTVYGSNKGLYWKTYRRGAGSGPLCENCQFIQTGAEAPGGSGHVAFDDSAFYRSGGNDIQINHHCHVDNDTGGLCASHFDFRTSQFFEYSHAEQLYVPGQPLFRSGKLPTASLVFTPGNEVLFHVDENHNSLAFGLDDYMASGVCVEEVTRFTQAGWFACQDDSPEDLLGLRIVRIYSPDRGALTVTNHTEGDASYVIPFTQHGDQNGGATKMGYILHCSGPECANYMQTSGYLFVVPDGAELSLAFEHTPASEAVLSDLLALEYSDIQMTPETSITIRSVEGTGLMDMTADCVVSSTHDRAFITPYGPIHGAAGALYNECGGQWPLKFSMQQFIDGSYAGTPQGPGDTGGGEPGGGDQGGAQPSSPEVPSAWPTLSHPQPEDAIGLYSALYPDAFSALDGEITWFPVWSQQSHYEFDYGLPESASNEGDRVLYVTLPEGVAWMGLLEFPPGQALALGAYDRLRFEIWTAHVSSLSVKVRDYGANLAWDAALDDTEVAKPIALDDNLIPGQWSTIDIALDELFTADAPRHLGQLLLQDMVAPGSTGGTHLYLQNIYIYRDSSDVSDAQ